MFLHSGYIKTCWNDEHLKKCHLSKSNTNIRFSENMKFPLKRRKKTTKTSPLLSDYTPPPDFIPIPITQLFTFLRPPHVHLNII